MNGRKDFFELYDEGFYNGAGETAPAYAVLQIDSVQTDDRREYITIKKPDGTGKGYLVNCTTDVADTERGLAADHGDPYALYESSDGTPAAGEEWGPLSGGWKLRKNGSGFLILGDSDGTKVRVRFLGAAGSTLTAVAILSTVNAATEDIATDADQCELSGVSVTCKALISTGTGKQAYHLTDSPSVTARSYYKTAITVTSGKWRLGYVIDGELIVADCAEFTLPPGA